MSASMVVALTCDSDTGCDDHFWTGSSDPDDVRSDAKAHGWAWRWDADGADYCDFCPEHA